MSVKQPNFLELKNSQTSDSLYMIFFKNENILFGQINIYVFLGGDICFTYQFLEDQKLKQERSCESWEKISDLSDLTPDVRSYPVLRYARINLPQAAASTILQNHSRLPVFIFSVRIAALGYLKRVKGTVSRDFRLLVFFMNQFLPSP